MAIKLRRFSTSQLTKFLAFVLVVVLITTAVLQIFYLSWYNLNLEAVFIEQYQDSSSFIHELTYNLYQVERIPEKGLPENEIGYYYFLDDGSEQYSNAPSTDKEFFARYTPAFFAFEKGQLSVEEKEEVSTITARLSTYRTNKELTLYLAYPSEYLAAKEQDWQQDREFLTPRLIGIGLSLFSALLLVIYLFSVTGRKSEDRELHLSLIDNIYSDLLILAMIAIGFIWLMGVARSFETWSIWITGILDINQIYSLIRVGILTAIITTLYGVILLSLARKFKARKLIKHSLCYTICYWIFDFFKGFIDGRRYKNNSLTRILFLRQRNFIIVSAVLVFFTFLFLIVPPLIFLPILLELVVIYWYIKSNNDTYVEINKGFNESLEEQMRAERHKIALVTNVSHDLKTPLTSIISYVDLLAKEEDLSETARDYVTILVEKSARLKNIVSDLFDLAKSTSGDIALEMESLDLKKLIQQTLADMEDKLAESGLQIRSRFPENPVNIYADGKKLYRVFQNIIDNALKYSLQGTRVYIELVETDGKAVATVKNTAGYEMEFTAEEILQRFARGDKARATEGSGLGLSIAESFTHVCGGDFKVDVDGDLFKVTISFDKV